MLDPRLTLLDSLALEVRTYMYRLFSEVDISLIQGYCDLSTVGSGR